MFDKRNIVTTTLSASVHYVVLLAVELPLEACMANPFRRVVLTFWRLCGTGSRSPSRVPGVLSSLDVSANV